MDLSDETRFRLRPGHAFLIVDLAILAGLFVLGGRVYMSKHGTFVLEEKRHQQAAIQIEGVERIQEADSVVAATEDRVAGALSDSARAIDNLRNLRDELDRRIAETQRLSQGIYRLSDVVLDMRRKAESAVRQAGQDHQNVQARISEVDSLRRTEQAARQQLVQTQSKKEEASERLARARAGEQYDPKGRFPLRTGLMVRRDMGDEFDTTNLLLQHVLWKRGRTDLGLSVGWGLGSEESTSNKELGLVFSRNLVHRRVGFDLSAGFSQLTHEQGEDDSGAYASAGLSVSPFYKERIHLGLGAKAFRDEVIPFLGLSLGRR